LVKILQTALPYANYCRAIQNSPVEFVQTVYFTACSLYGITNYTVNTLNVKL